jgi:hypothetical protein
MPETPAKTRLPDGGDATKSAGLRASDKLRSRTKTILTSKLGVVGKPPTASSTLLGVAGQA